MRAGPVSTLLVTLLACGRAPSPASAGSLPAAERGPHGGGCDQAALRAAADATSAMLAAWRPDGGELPDYRLAVRGLRAACPGLPPGFHGFLEYGIHPVPDIRSDQMQLGTPLRGDPEGLRPLVRHCPGYHQILDDVASRPADERIPTIFEGCKFAELGVFTLAELASNFGDAGGFHGHALYLWLVDDGAPPAVARALVRPIVAGASYDLEVGTTGAKLPAVARAPAAGELRGEDQFVGHVSTPAPAPEASEAAPILPPPTCPQGHISERLSGAVAGFALVEWEGNQAILSGVVGRDAAPPSPTELTVIREIGTERITTFTRKTFQPGKDRATSYILEIPLSLAPERERDVFVTDACLAIPATTRLRQWTMIPFSRRPIEELRALAAEVRPYLLAQLPAKDRRALERFGVLRPMAVGELPSTLPGCPRVVAVSNDMSEGLKGYDFVSALLCVDAGGAVVRALARPRRGPMIGQFALVDLDADGVDELIATTSTMGSRGSSGSRDELYWWDAAASEIRSATLGAR